MALLTPVFGALTARSTGALSSAVVVATVRRAALTGETWPPPLTAWTGPVRAPAGTVASTTVSDTGVAGAARSSPRPDAPVKRTTETVPRWVPTSWTTLLPGVTARTAGQRRAQWASLTAGAGAANTPPPAGVAAPALAGAARRLSAAARAMRMWEGGGTTSGARRRRV